MGFTARHEIYQVPSSNYLRIYMHAATVHEQNVLRWFYAKYRYLLINVIMASGKLWDNITDLG
jgi:hypothetical protein